MRAHILCTVHAGAKLWTHLARAAHQPTWEKTTFWIQISYNKSTCIRKLFDVAMWLKSEINPNENTFLELLISIPGRVAQILKHTIYEIHIMNNHNNFLRLGFKAAQKFKSYQYAWWTWPFSKVNENKLKKQGWSILQNSIVHHVDLSLQLKPMYEKIILPLTLFGPINSFRHKAQRR